MGRETDALWAGLLERTGTRREYAFEIAGVRYGPEAVVRHSVTRALFEEFGFGNANSARLELTLAADSIPRAAEIRRYVRLVNGEEASPWLWDGQFFTNRRAEENGLWTLEAFDVLRKAEAVWEPGEELAFPLSMPAAAAELARLLGCALDSRTELDPAYTVDHPPTDTTVRQELQYIAAAHGGNWTVTGRGELLLVPLGSEPKETHYLVTERGGAITLGGVRILV